MRFVYRMKDSMLKFRAAIRFRQFSAKLLQIRLFEKINARLFLPLEGKPVFLPKNVIIRITERCFLKCKMCGQGGEKGRLRGVKMANRLVFDHDVLSRVIEEIGQWRIKPFLKITGGEPLLERELTLEALERAHRLGIVTKLNTNGVLLANEKIARRVATTGLHYLSISIDGPPEVHNRIRGRSGAFERAVEGIRNVQRYRKEAGNTQLMILVSAVLSQENQTQIIELVRLMEYAGVDWLNFEFMNFTTAKTTAESQEVCKDLFGIPETPWAAFSNESSADVNAYEIARQIEAIQSRNISIPISFLNIGDCSPEAIEHYYHHPEINLCNNICSMPFTAAFLMPPHHMGFCIDYPFYFYADLNKGSVADGWFGEKAQEFRNRLVKYYKEQGRNFPHCQRCNWRFN